MKRLALLLLALTASAWAKPTNPFVLPLKDWAFWTGTANFAASEITDVYSTKSCERTLRCVEAYKGHDRYSYIAPQIALVAAGEYGCFLMLHDHKWWRRTVCPGIAAGLSIIHWKDASTIYRVDYKAKP